MRLGFIGSGIEREATQLEGIEVLAVARVARDHFDTLVFGGSSVGLMADFAKAFAGCGGRVLSIVPRWLQQHGLVYQGGKIVFCSDLAERKRLMFDEVDAVLGYPGGVGTWDELFDLLARRAVESQPSCPPVYLYSWENYYAPLLLQMEVAAEVGLVHPHALAPVQSFGTVDQFAELLQAASTLRRPEGPPTIVVP